MAAPNIVIPVETIIGPAGRFRYVDNRMPETEQIAPNIELNIKYLAKLELMVLAAAAGVTTRKPTSRVPVIFMPIATVRDTSRRYSRFVLATLIPVEVASSSEIKLKTIFL